MYVVTFWNLKNGETFEKEFYSQREVEIMQRKCKYSKKLKIISIMKYH